jgi:hypothetical protein
MATEDGAVRAAVEIERIAKKSPETGAQRTAGIA